MLSHYVTTDITLHSRDIHSSVNVYVANIEVLSISLTVLKHACITKLEVKS